VKLTQSRQSKTDHLRTTWLQSSRGGSELSSVQAWARIWHLRRVEKMPIEVIARTVGWSKNTVKQRPVLTMVCGYSRWLSAGLAPTRYAEDLFAGWWALISHLRAAPRYERASLVVISDKPFRALGRSLRRRYGRRLHDRPARPSRRSRRVEGRPTSMTQRPRPRRPGHRRRTMTSQGASSVRPGVSFRLPRTDHGALGGCTSHSTFESQAPGPLERSP
jgi:hypothetical protein